MVRVFLKFLVPAELTSCALCLLLVMAGCVPRQNTAQEDVEPQQQSSYDRYSGYDENESWGEQDPAIPAMFSRIAQTALGTPYVRGGSNMDGFDCSGFVVWTYKQLGVELPRTAREQSDYGTPVPRYEDMRVGDIVTFRHPRRGYHTGIYMGDGRFIHSPRKRQSVRISSLDDPYFRDTFTGARRVEMDGPVMMQAAASLPPSRGRTAAVSAASTPKTRAAAARTPEDNEPDTRVRAARTQDTKKTSATASRAATSKKNVSATRSRTGKSTSAAQKPSARQAATSGSNAAQTKAAAPKAVPEKSGSQKAASQKSGSQKAASTQAVRPAPAPGKTPAAAKAASSGKSTRSGQSSKAGAAGKSGQPAKKAKSS